MIFSQPIETYRRSHVETYTDTWHILPMAASLDSNTTQRFVQRSYGPSLLNMNDCYCHHLLMNVVTIVKKRLLVIHSKHRMAFKDQSLWATGSSHQLFFAILHIPPSCIFRR